LGLLPMLQFGDRRFDELARKPQVLGVGGVFGMKAAWQTVDTSPALAYP